MPRPDEGLRLVPLDPDRHYPPHVLVSGRPDSLRLEADLSSGTDLRFALRDRPHAAVAYVLSSTYRKRGGLRAAYYPLIAFPAPPPTDELLEILNCCKWSERLLDQDWETPEFRCRVFGCRVTERYLLELVYRLYRADGFVIPGHVGLSSDSGHTLPFHVDLAESDDLDLDPDTVAEIRRHYACDVVTAVESMSAYERSLWGIEGAGEACS